MPIGNLDPYVYPGTSVLRNLRDLRDQESLSRFEANIVSARGAELQMRPTQGKFDRGHLQAVHRHLFQDVFAWAGEFRTVNISRSGQFPFAFAEQIVPSLENLLSKLAREERLAGLERTAFCARAAWFLGELNAIHPFREGNGRTQREFVRQLSAVRGWPMDWRRVSRDEMTAASKASFQRGDNSGLERILLAVTEMADAAR